MADCERAARLDANLAEVDYARGQLFLDAGWLQSAELALSQFISRRPDHASAHETLAHVLLRRADGLKAAVEFTKAIQLSPHPAPEWYIARASAVAAAPGDPVDEAIRGLDEGIKRLGPIVTLQSAAIDLELRRANFDAALGRLETVARQSERKEQWLVRRGDILRQASRMTEARQAYDDALRAIGRLAPVRRNTDAVAALAKHAELGLKELAITPTSQPGGTKE